MNEEQFERLVSAFESIAKSLSRWSEVSFPEKKTPEPMTITRVPTEEDKAREAQGDTDEPIEEWIDIGIGPREQRIIDAEDKESKKMAEGNPEKTGN
jgi:hypothetical protein